jgi:hypothetical protein
MSELSQGAVEAAAQAIWDQRPMMRLDGGAPMPFESLRGDGPYHDRYMGLARAALSAAAPYLAAQTLRDAANALDLPGSTATGYYSSNDEAGYREAERDTERWLRDRADRIEAP